MGLLIGIGSGNTPRFPYSQFYGVKLASHATSTSQSLEAVNSSLMDDSNSPIWTRIRSFVENNDGSVNYYLDKYDARYKQGGTVLADITGADGNVMVEIPAHYRREEWRDGDFYKLYSDYALPGFYYVPRRVLGKFMASLYTGTTSTGALVQNGLVSNSCIAWDSTTYQGVNSGDTSPLKTKSVTVDSLTYNVPDMSSHLAIAQACRPTGYSSYDDTYRSMLGMCKTELSRTNYRTYCNNVNTAHSITETDKILHVGMYHIYNELAWLIRTKILNYDIQNYTGWCGSATMIDSSSWSNNFGYRPFVPNGITSPLGDRIGYVKYSWVDSNGSSHTTNCPTAFGVEMPINYIWQISDDLLEYNNNGTNSTAYWCSDPTKYATPSDSGEESWASANGYVSVAGLPMSDGSIARESFDSNGHSLPKEIGSGQVGDYYYHGSSSGWYGSFFGGSAPDGSTSGFGYLNAHSRPSVTLAYIGARLCRN